MCLLIKYKDENLMLKKTILLDRKKIQFIFSPLPACILKIEQIIIKQEKASPLGTLRKEPVNL